MDCTVKETKICCICGSKFTGWGNNPWPVKEEGECCDECNGKYVLSARLVRMFGNSKEDNND